MTPDELLRLYPRETLRWLRRRLGLSQFDFGLRVGVSPGTPGHWEARRHGISDEHRARLAAVLASHLATLEGAAFQRSLGGEEPLGVVHPTDPGRLGSLTTRAGLREVWHAGERGWDAAPEEHRGRNLAIAQAYLETDEPIQAIAARHGVSRSRVPAVARTVVYHILGRRPPTR
jgi:transcriptional regulator with XRE-family HTH domain